MPSPSHNKSQKLIIGCGYLGTRVARHWQETGAQVDALTRSAERAAILQRDGLNTIIGDVTQPETLHLPQVGTVLHAVGFDRASGQSQREVYVNGLRNVLDALEGRCERFIYISSTSVYGDHDGAWVSEETPCQPTTDSGRICLDAESLLWDHPIAQSCTVNVLRLAGIYGPNRLLRRLEALKNNDPLPGDPDGWLNLIHVDDAAAVVAACERHGKPNETYLICDDRPVSRREYYGELASLSDAPPPAFDGTAATRGGNRRCSNRKLHSEWGFELRFPTITSGLRNAMDMK